VVRGGGWSSAARYCRSAMRFNEKPDYCALDVGFRLSRSIGLGY
jgi:formylglycine-generating enzyme required for sulfatase activity